MKLYNILIISILIAIAAFACHRNAQSSVMEKYIIIGDGGGFTGVETLYLLNSKGEVRKGDVLLARLSKSEVKQVWSNLDLLNLNEMNYEIPGNMYKLIEFKKDTTAMKLVWDPYDETHPRNLDLFYDHLKHLINKNSK